MMDEWYIDCILYKLFTNEQHGFVPKRNCTTQLLESIETWCKVIEEHGYIDVIYTNFAKAFDAVPHKRLMRKVKSYGFKGDLLNWIKSFLTNRRQRVKVGGSILDWSKVKSGVPQGSVLGPILFVIYINDMPEVISNSCKLFADDAKIFGRLHGNFHSISKNVNAYILDAAIEQFHTTLTALI